MSFTRHGSGNALPMPARAIPGAGHVVAELNTELVRIPRFNEMAQS